MRLDPLDIVAHTALSLPIRVLIVWVVGTLGAFCPLLFGYGFDAFAGLGWQMMFFPLYLFILAVASGWWAFVAVPLLLPLAWKGIRFIREDNTPHELHWIFILAYGIGIRASHERWMVAALVGVLALSLLLIAPRWQWLVKTKDRQRQPR